MSNSPSITATSLPSLGNRVKVVGLIGRADLNGRLGKVIEGYNENTGRLGVRVFPTFTGEAAEGIHIKPENVQEDPLIFLDGFEVVESGEETLGRVAVATRDYSRGDTVLVEPPTFVFDPQRGIHGMMEGYERATPEQRNQIMDMYCPPLPNNDPTQKPTNPVIRQKQAETKQRLQMLEHLWNLFVQMKPNVRDVLPLDTAKKLMRIIDANAHSYSLETTGGLVATPSTLPTEYNALFARGSKVEHSCAPNLTYATDHGKLIYTASRDTKQGDRLSISYQTAGFGHPRSQRQEFLHLNKDFTCQCCRCVGFDECSPYEITCPNCKHAKAVVFSFQTQDNFLCICCQSQIPTDSIHQRQETERCFLQRLQRIEYNLQSGNFQRTPVRAISDMAMLQNEMGHTLHPLHWLHPKGYRILSSLAASLARMLLRKGKSPKSANCQPLLYLSSISLLHEARWLQQAGSIIYNDSNNLKEVATRTWIPIRLSVKPALEDVQALADQIVDSTTHSNQSVMDMAHPLFHAGQDWLLAGHAVQVAQFYHSFMPLFEHWTRLGDENREKMAILVSSKGAQNPFPNHLIL